MSVDIAAGYAYLHATTVTAQGVYGAYNDAVYNLTGFTAAHATNPRVDRVALRLRDAFHGDAANDWTFVILTGTATAGATLANLTGAAAVPANHLLLANILIPANATSVITANIDTTVRRLATDYAYGEFSGGAIALATSAPGTTVVTAPSSTYDGAARVKVEFFAPLTDAALMTFELNDGTSNIGILGYNGQPGGGAVNLVRYFIPPAGTRAYSVRGYASTGGLNVYGGVGGSGTRFPMFLRLSKA